MTLSASRSAALCLLRRIVFLSALLLQILALQVAACDALTCDALRHSVALKPRRSLICFARCTFSIGVDLVGVGVSRKLIDDAFFSASMPLS